MTPRMEITWTVLERAKDAGDAMVIAACRRIIAADRIDWRKHGTRTTTDWCGGSSPPPNPYE